jgi:hypothetical protein
MFDIKRTNPVIPGYTGHIPKNLGEGDSLGDSQPRSQIPGYAGFIPGVKSENIFGKTYGKSTYMSSAGEYQKGSEIPDEERYTSILQDSFVNLKTVKDRTVADVVGVSPLKTIYTQTGPIKVDSETFYSTQTKKEKEDTKKEEDIEQSTKAFYGDFQDEKKVVKKGDPIPGYTGVSRRVVADNVFGATYAASRQKGQNSLDTINVEKSVNLQKQGTSVPPIKK